MTTEYNDIRADGGRLLVALAATLPGWRVVQHEGSYDLVHSEGANITIPCDASNLRRDRLVAWSRKLIRYADDDTPRPDLAALRKSVGVKVNTTRGVDKAVDEAWPIPAAEPQAAPAVDPEPAAPTIVSVNPARAHASGNRTYRSNVAVVRTWSDGTTDYACNHGGCDFTSDALRSVAAHYRTHAIVGVNPADGVDPNHVPEARLKTRIDNLAAELTAAFEAGLDSADDIAQFIIEARIERRDVSENTEGLTADDILRRIALLVDRGETPRLQAELSQAQAAIADAEARASKAEGSLDALRDLLTD